MALIDVLNPSIKFEPYKLLHSLIENGYAENEEKAYQYFLRYPNFSIENYVKDVCDYYISLQSMIEYDIREIKAELIEYLNVKNNCS